MISRRLLTPALNWPLSSVIDFNHAQNSSVLPLNVMMLFPLLNTFSRAQHPFA
jgi:hypothetical protein